MSKYIPGCIWGWCGPLREGYPIHSLLLFTALRTLPKALYLCRIPEFEPCMSNLLKAKIQLFILLERKSEIKKKNGRIEDRRQNCALPRSGLAVNFSSRGTLSLSTWQTGPGCLSSVWAVGQDEWLDFALVIETRFLFFPPVFRQEI